MLRLLLWLRSLGRRNAAAPTYSRDILIDVLQRARAMLALEGNDFSWSSWEDSDAALAELDGLIETLRAGGLPERLALAVLFAPTGPLQETSLSSGWGQEFIDLAAEFDRAIANYPRENKPRGGD